MAARIGHDATIATSLLHMKPQLYVYCILSFQQIVTCFKIHFILVLLIFCVRQYVC